MPTIAVDKADLWERLGQEFCTQFHALPQYILTNLLNYYVSYGGIRPVVIRVWIGT